MRSRGSFRRRLALLRGPRRESEAVENFPHRLRWVDGGEYPQPAAAFTGQDVKFENPFHHSKAIFVLATTRCLLCGTKSPH